MTESKTEAINRLKEENYALKNRCKFLEDEVNRLKSVTLNLSTEMTATKMSKWNLSNPEELYEIENGIAERAALKDNSTMLISLVKIKNPVFRRTTCR